ncbi:hypothetical protein B7494_g5338 [Chlorociboria aeruginascens]|nr:hypothetical protein B7494_g5338 [Chlorociboria aeruginascens]
MLSQIIMALGLMVTLATAQIPSGGTPLPLTLIVTVVDSTGATLGSLNGYGNFSSPGPDYPFNSRVNTDGTNTLSGYGACYLDNGVLDCYYPDGIPVGTIGEFYEESGLLALIGSGTEFSVSATTDAAGGLDPFGRSYGIPVYAGDVAAIPVTLSIAGASG